MKTLFRIITSTLAVTAKCDDILDSRFLNLSSKLDVSGLRLAQAMISQSDLEDGMAVRDGFVVCIALHCTAVDRSIGSTRTKKYPYVELYHRIWKVKINKRVRKE